MRDERGFALPLAMLVVLILSALMLGLAETLTSEFSAALPASRDLRAAYLAQAGDRKSTRLNSSHLVISYAVFCLKTKNTFANVHYSSCYSIIDRAILNST